MTIMVNIPDELARLIQVEGEALSRHILEVVAVEAYRNGNLSGSDLRRFLGLESDTSLDDLLAAHGLPQEESGKRSGRAQTLKEVFESVRGLADDVDFSRNPSPSRPVNIA